MFFGHPQRGAWRSRTFGGARKLVALGRLVSAARRSRWIAPWPGKRERWAVRTAGLVLHKCWQCAIRTHKNGLGQACLGVQGEAALHVAKTRLAAGGTAARWGSCVPLR